MPENIPTITFGNTDTTTEIPKGNSPEPRTDDLAVLSDESGDDESKPDAEETEEAEESDETGDSEEESESESDDESESGDVSDESEEKVEGDKNIVDSLKGVDKDIFKKVPGLKVALEREEAFTSLFPDLQEAEIASKVLPVYRALDAQLGEGDTEPLLKALKGGGSLESVAHGFLPALQKVDKGAYNEIVTVLGKQLLSFAFHKGRDAKNDQIWASAYKLNQFLFGDTDVDKGAEFKTKTSNGDDDKIAKERNENLNRAHENFRADVSEIFEYDLNKIIEQAILPVEGDKYYKKNISRDIYGKLRSMLLDDKRHQASMKSLWNQARSAGYSRDWRVKIKNAEIAKARELIGKAKKEVFVEAKVKVNPTKDTSKKLITGTSSGGGKENPRITSKDLDFSNPNIDRDVFAGNFDKVLKKGRK